MPYKAGSRLSSEKASKLGHLDVIQSELVNELVEQFERPEIDAVETDAVWETMPAGRETATSNIRRRWIATGGPLRSAYTPGSNIHKDSALAAGPAGNSESRPSRPAPACYERHNG